MMFELKVRTCCSIHHVPVSTSIRRLSLSPSYICMMDKIGDKIGEGYCYLTCNSGIASPIFGNSQSHIVMGCNSQSHIWYLTAPPVTVLVTVELVEVVD